MKNCWPLHNPNAILPDHPPAK